MIFFNTYVMNTNRTYNSFHQQTVAFIFPEYKFFFCGSVAEHDVTVANSS